jgi:hypothetical protein
VQELRQQQHKYSERRKQREEQRHRQFRSPEPVAEGQRNQSNRNEAYSDGSHPPPELIAMNGKECTADSFNSLHGNATHGSAHENRQVCDPDYLEPNRAWPVSGRW